MTKPLQAIFNSHIWLINSFCRQFLIFWKLKIIRVQWKYTVLSIFSSIRYILKIKTQYQTICLLDISTTLFQIIVIHFLLLKIINILICRYHTQIHPLPTYLGTFDKLYTFIMHLNTDRAKWRGSPFSSLLQSRNYLHKDTFIYFESLSTPLHLALRYQLFKYFQCKITFKIITYNLGTAIFLTNWSFPWLVYVVMNVFVLLCFN